MTAVDHAELKRLAEGAADGPWQNGIEDLEGVVAPQNPGLGNVVCIPPKRNMYSSLEAWPDNAAFIAAANPAVVLALLSEIEGLKAERDRLMRASNKDNAIIKRLSERKARTQAPDSWRPDRGAVARVLKAWCEGGLLQDYASVADAILALRPQTAESGK